MGWGNTVPIDILSGYVKRLPAVTDDASSLDFAVEVMQPLKVVENFSMAPGKRRYCAFQEQQGWSYANGESLDNPNWQGNAKGIDVARISYRSMDAMALLMLHDKRHGDAGDGEVRTSSNWCQRVCFCRQ